MEASFLPDLHVVHDHREGEEQSELVACCQQHVTIEILAVKFLVVDIFQVTWVYLYDRLARVLPQPHIIKCLQASALTYNPG